MVIPAGNAPDLRLLGQRWFRRHRRGRGGRRGGAPVAARRRPARVALADQGGRGEGHGGADALEEDVSSRVDASDAGQFGHAGLIAACFQCFQLEPLSTLQEPSLDVARLETQTHL